MVVGVAWRVLGQIENDMTDDFTIQYKPALPGKPAELECAEDEYREAIGQLIDFARRRDMFICGYHDRMMAYDVTLLAMGFYEVLGCNTQSQLARKYRVTKAAIARLQTKFNDFMGMEGKRSDAARLKMSQKRKEQLI
jgi:hypothetical protein